MNGCDLVIIGAGAAGLMAARAAAQRGKRVMLLERNPRPGAKILVSGGGRCNFTNLKAGPANYRSSNPDFCRSALARFKPSDFVALVEAHQIRYHEKKAGQLFCDKSARDILDMLVADCKAAGVDLRCDIEVGEVEKTAAGFRLSLQGGELIETPKLVLATGGLSFPKIGATDFGLRVARQFGLNVLDLEPALDGFVFAAPDKKVFDGLQGLSFEGALKMKDGRVVREDLLFTHQGLSGPGALTASLWWNRGEAMELDFMPGGFDWRGAKVKHPKVRALDVLSWTLPRRLADRFSELYQNEKARSGWLGEMKNEDLEAFEAKVRGYRFTPAGTVGFDLAEVSKGGVDTRELSSKTFECAKVPGLHIIGELLDVTGELGGFNFQWAWASGQACGMAV